MTSLVIYRKATAEELRGKLLSQGIGPKNFASIGKFFTVLDAYGDLPEDYEGVLEGSLDVEEIDRVLVYRLLPAPSNESFVRVVTREEAVSIFKPLSKSC